MSDTPAQFQAKMRRAPAVLNKAAEDAAGASALVLKKSVLAQLDRVAPRRTVKGRKGKPAKLDASYKVTGGATPTARLNARGPWHFVERDTKRHRELPIHGKKKALVMPGIGLRARVNHPGTRGRHPFAKGVEAARPNVRQEIVAELDKGLRAVLK